MQVRSSRNTSVNKAKLPAIFKKIGWGKPDSIGNVDSVLDYGCGKYPHVVKNWMKKYYPWIDYHCYDPMQEIGKPHHASLAILSNVINVIDDDNAVCETVNACLRYAPAVAITVYEGNKTGIGRETKKDCWQSNRTTKMWCDFLMAHGFNIIRIGKLIVVKGEECQ